MYYSMYTYLFTLIYKLAEIKQQKYSALIYPMLHNIIMYLSKSLKKIFHINLKEFGELIEIFNVNWVFAIFNI